MPRRVILLPFVVLALVVGVARRPVAQVEPVSARGPQFLAMSPTAKRLVDASDATVLRRRLSLSFRETLAETALAEIARQAGLDLFYSAGVIPSERRVTLRAEGITLAAALTQVLLGTGLDVVLQGRNRMALVNRGALHAARGPAGIVTGRVTDAKTAQQVPGAEVFLDGTKWKTTTDSKGNYRLAEVDTGNYMLTVRRLGYTRQSRRVTVREGAEDTVNVALEPVAARLDELVTTATGVQRRRDLGNAITTIKADSVMQAAPIRNLTDLLATRVPGLTVQHTSGVPGDPARLRLRGLGSVTRSNDPVVVVDGVRIYAAQSGERSGNLVNLGGGMNINLLPGRTNLPAPSPLDQIDPNIIEKIDVFKGPSAATLYGADAANGVIVITTKKGRPGPARWSGTLTHGITNMIGRYPTGYYRWGHSIEDNAPVFCTIATPGAPCVADSLVQYQALNDPRLTVFDQGRRTSGSLTVSGGSQALTYSVTSSYENETSPMRLPELEVDRFRSLMGREAPDWMQRPHQYTKWNVTSTVGAILGPTADVTLSTKLARSEQVRTSLEEQISVLEGTYVDRVNGVYYVPYDARGTALRTTANFLQNYYQRTSASAITINTGLNANWHPRPWFSGSGSAGIDIIPRRDEQLLPALPGLAFDSATLIRTAGRSLVGTFNLQGTARRLLGRGFRFETGAGVNVVSDRTDDVVASASGLLPGTSSLSGATHFTNTDRQSNSSVFGWYVEPRIAGERLSLSTGIRLDGGSAYGARLTRQSGGLFGLLSLPKLNGSWVISEEPWFPFKTMFNSLRLRGAYGQAQVQPGAADQLRLYQHGKGDDHFLLNKLGNTELRPERSAELEGGFDADLLDNRLTVEVSGYRKVQHDALLPLTLPGSVNGGNSTVLTNIGTIRNAGLELRTILTPVRGPTTWTMELNYSRNVNLLVDLGPGVATNRETGLVAGYPVGSVWRPYRVGFADQNGDGVLQLEEIKLSDSLIYLGHPLPTYQTSLHTSLALWNGAISLAGSMSYDAGALRISDPTSINWVLSRALVDPSSPLGEQAAAISGGGGVSTEVSTFRFQSLSVRYRAPAALVRVLRAQELSIAVQGDNLGLHSTYKGKDPDVMAWNAGESIVDTGQLPRPRTWWLTLNVRY